MFANNIQARFVVPVSIFIILVVLGGALIFSRIENQRISAEVTVETRQKLFGVTQILGVIDSLVIEQSHSAMLLLLDSSSVLGSASLGPTVQVKGKSVPDLLLGEKAQANQYDLVDSVTKIAGGIASLYIKAGDDFVCVSTSDKVENERATGTILDPKGKPIAAIRDGKAFYGMVDILGNPFLMGYEPLRDWKGEVIGILNVGYKVDINVLYEIIGKSRLMQNGFLAIVDSSGKLRFHSDHVSAEQVKNSIEDNPNWVLAKQEFASWGFSVILAHANDMS